MSKLTLVQLSSPIVRIPSNPIYLIPIPFQWNSKFLKIPRFEIPSIFSSIYSIYGSLSFFFFRLFRCFKNFSQFRILSSLLFKTQLNRCINFPKFQPVPLYILSSLYPPYSSASENLKLGEKLAILDAKIQHWLLSRAKEVCVRQDNK